ncbi:MAG: ATP-grasp domain-containing protein [Bacteroidales bacterium]|nr:ATP-grasp domain-containing protein [Bacteroidales bacterium]MDT8374967.1 ATP-grasp domain-containing protein [Bacteroidales bacterium]
MRSEIRGKSILIFGAGLNQLELISEARKLGLVTVVVDPQPDPPGKPEADFFYRVEGSDYDATRSVALRHSVSGIVTGQMEKPLRLMARLAEELGFIFNSPDVTERSTDKWLMKESFMAAGVSCAEGILIRSDEEPAARLKAAPAFPVIIKPRDAFSSRGVFRCCSPEEVLSYVDISRRFATAGDILIEEFIHGREYSVEAITFRGETTIIQFTEKFTTPYPTTVETGHLQPAGLTAVERECIAEVVVRALRALGIENSASHTEVMLTANGPKVIEVGARLGGDFIASYLTRSSTGVSMDRAAIQVALGMAPDLRSDRRDYSMISFIELPAGKRVVRVHDTGDIAAMPGVVFARLFVRPGDITEPVTHSAHRAGCVIVAGSSWMEVTERAWEYSKLLAKKAELI